MKKTLKSFAFGSAVFCGVLALSACGDDVTKVTNVTEASGMEIAKSADDFEKCDSASFGKMMFASDENAAYICADSGWTQLSKKASDGKDGASCTAEILKDGTGYKIVCGEDSVGVIKNGKAGVAGVNGTSCSAELLKDSTGYKIVCGEDSVGVVLNGSKGTDGANGSDGNGCTLTDNGDGTLSQVCGETSVTLYKALCGDKAYDPAKAFCLENTLYSCGGKPYNPAKSFCFADSAYGLCGGKTYDPTKGVCYADSVYGLCGGKTYNPEKNFCYADSVYTSCGGKAYVPGKEFCDDRDSAVYGYVQIGNQVWMAENLNYAYPKASETATDSSSYCYNDSLANCETYGRLYTWDAAMDACPSGWHLSSYDEWVALRSYIRETEGGNYYDDYYACDRLKATSGWAGENGNGTDTFGFGGLPAGSRVYGIFDGKTYIADFWTSTEDEDNSEIAQYFRLDYATTYLQEPSGDKSSALSVRCIKN